MSSLFATENLRKTQTSRNFKKLAASATQMTTTSQKVKAVKIIVVKIGDEGPKLPVEVKPGGDLQNCAIV